MESRGVRIGGLTIIGAGTGAGKSVFVLNQLMYSYKVEKLNTCLLNLELGADETMARMYAHASNTDFNVVYGNEDIVEIVQTWKNDYFSEDNIFTMKNVRFDTEEIVEIIRQQASLGVTVFGIDYLQLVDSAYSKKEWEALRDLVRALHTLTLELGIVIISPVQINLDEVDEGDGKVKIKVRGSRELENSSTLFLFIYQSVDEYKEDVARIFTIKARNARKYTYVVQTDFTHMKFVDTGVVL
jgi:replicative DNA helicase